MLHRTAGRGPREEDRRLQGARAGVHISFRAHGHARGVGDAVAAHRPPSADEDVVLLVQCRLQRGRVDRRCELRRPQPLCHPGELQGGQRGPARGGVPAVLWPGVQRVRRGVERRHRDRLVDGDEGFDGPPAGVRAAQQVGHRPQQVRGQMLHQRGARIREQIVDHLGDVSVAAAPEGQEGRRLTVHPGVWGYPPQLSPGGRHRVAQQRLHDPHGGTRWRDHRRLRDRRVRQRGPGRLPGARRCAARGAPVRGHRGGRPARARVPPEGRLGLRGGRRRARRCALRTARPGGGRGRLGPRVGAVTAGAGEDRPLQVRQVHGAAPAPGDLRGALTQLRSRQDVANSHRYATRASSLASWWRASCIHARASI
mmetsp:Transcript_65184/g.169631  ORF Transcript_65184/g.169631 Transcript_65184/m.169631 type:complete len:369 (+) Transcript_65184:1326-2432(+)